MPSTTSGAGMPADFEDGRHDVNDVAELLAEPPWSLMRPGQETAMHCRMPPSREAFCLNQVNGVSKAHDQPADMWL